MRRASRHIGVEGRGSPVEQDVVEEVRLRGYKASVTWLDPPPVVTQAQEA
ncbi:hypothetical protein WOLCODRAFT_159579 [Wolfiporia cocos MD-104 SS10]|uniref:Uncharacterized protein n=1 Tax=Wolfiporia cocos (strain MD-104) TaxID=742152 RepID=A0A2H3JGZ6_WOLCO|nr:hypothetical protein WOLCODRAFT_159579 [Wolfiporia cocos MD-104 SS10]